MFAGSRGVLVRLCDPITPGYLVAPTNVMGVEDTVADKASTPIVSSDGIWQ